MLTAAGRCARWGVTLVVLVLVLSGTVWGQDDDFPFGPFRMYSTRDDPDGLVRAARVEAVDRGGRLLLVDESSTGLKRAEIEGQAARFRADPKLLRHLAVAHARLRPDEPRLVEIRVVELSYRLRDSHPTGDLTERVVARWRAP